MTIVLTFKLSVNVTNNRLGSSRLIGTAAHSFSNLVQPTKRFQVALNVLVPVLEGGDNHNDLAQHILASFILNSLRTPSDPINPFKSVLVEALVKEQRIAVQGPENEPFVWALSNILREDENDIGSYSTIMLTGSPLPPAANYEPTPTKSASTETETRTPPNPNDEEENENLTRTMQLILNARGRALTLSEQRVTSTRDMEEEDGVLSPFLEVLTRFPPNLATLDSMERLLYDSTPLPSRNHAQKRNQQRAEEVWEAQERKQKEVRDLIKGRPRLVRLESIRWLEDAEREERWE
ncbi:hypothetical protein V5O48_009837 [Marasmius crinis-equi]|uniref:Uncharacterized protein n=1 Tax=Marasmius crinis-equi TaxID=585013 RepID=A0ABR3FAI4_9AGAR